MHACIESMSTVVMKFSKQKVVHQLHSPITVTLTLMLAEVYTFLTIHSNFKISGGEVTNMVLFNNVRRGVI